MGDEGVQHLLVATQYHAGLVPKSGKILEFRDSGLTIRLLHTISLPPYTVEKWASALTLSLVPLYRLALHHSRSTSLKV